MIGTSSVGYSPHADLFTISRTANTTDHAGMTIRSGTAGQSSIYFSDATGQVSGTWQSSIWHDHSGGHLNIYTQDFLKFHSGSGERLRIGSSGQIGLSGANYGSSGQVLTSNGSGSAPTWQTVSGGGGGGSGISVSDATALAFQCG